MRALLYGLHVDGWISIKSMLSIYSFVFFGSAPVDNDEKMGDSGSFFFFGWGRRLWMDGRLLLFCLFLSVNTFTLLPRRYYVDKVVKYRTLYYMRNPGAQSSGQQPPFSFLANGREKKNKKNK